MSIMVSKFGDWWRWGPLSGIAGDYIDLDFEFLGIRFLIHISYGKVR